MSRTNNQHGLKLVYRIIGADDWAAAQHAGHVAYSEIDLRDGYLHLSMRDQTIATANCYFAGHRGILALEILYTDIKDACRLEPVAEREGELFVHLYGPLPVSAVHGVLAMEEQTPGCFAFGERIR